MKVRTSSYHRFQTFIFKIDITQIFKKKISYMIKPDGKSFNAEQLDSYWNFAGNVTLVSLSNNLKQ